MRVEKHNEIQGLCEKSRRVRVSSGDIPDSRNGAGGKVIILLARRNL